LKGAARIRGSVFCAIRSQHNDQIGVTLNDLDDQTRHQYDIPEDLTGALIAQVKPGSKAADAGIKPGQVIIGIDCKPVANAADAMSAIGKADGDLLLKVWQEGARLYLVIPR